MEQKFYADRNKEQAEAATLRQNRECEESKDIT